MFIKLHSLNKPKYINAAVLFKKNKPLKILKLKIPKLKKGQVLVKLIFSGICRSQLMEIGGLRGKDPYLPHLLGHEGFGEVIEIGPMVKKVKVGQKVILSWIKSKGINAAGPIYYLNETRINAGPITTFSDFSIIAENRLSVAPKSINPIEGVLFGCAVPTGSGMVFNELKINYKKTTAIFGVGGVGIFSLIACKILKAKKIVAIDVNEKKLNIAKKLGATHTVNPLKENLLQKINIITSGKMIDYAIDCAGKVNTIENAFNIINNNGTCIFASHPEKNKKINIDPFELIKGKKIIGTWGGSVNPDIDIKKFYFKMKKSNINFKLINSNVYNFKNINRAIKDFSIGKVLRPIIKF